MEHSFLFIETYRGKLDWDFQHLEKKKQIDRIECIPISELTGITRVLETFTDV